MELTDKQLLELADGEIEADDVLPMDEYEAANDRALEVYRSELIAAMRAAIAAHEAALAAEPPAPDPREALAARPLLEAVARLGDCIGQHTVGEIETISDRAAAWLAENPPGQPVPIEPRGCPTPGACSCVEAPAPAPAADGERDHVPGAGNMVPAAYAARLRQCPTHGQLPANAWGCPECLRELREELARLRGSAADGEREELAQWLDEEAKRCAAQFHDRITRAAALLRQLPPEGLEAIRYCVEEDGAVIQRTSRAPESWAIRAGSACMSTTGEWDIEPMPSDRTDEWLANHRWPSAAAAWAALQQARRQEVGDE